MSDAEIRVRQFKADDLARINEIRAGLKLTGILASDCDGDGLTTFIAARASGVQAYITLKFPASTHQALDAEVNQLFASRDCRHQGFGRVLLTKAECHAIKMTPATQLTLEVSDTYTDAICCYIKFGFKVVGIKPPGLQMAKRVHRAPVIG